MGSRPRQVNIALALMLGASVAYLLESLLRLYAAPPGARLMLAPGVLLGLLVRLALVDLIARRKDWARAVFLVLVGLWLTGGLPADVENALDGTWQGELSLVPLGVGVALTAAAAVLLVLRQANDWFRVAPIVAVQGVVGGDGEWFYGDGNVTRGPVSEADLREMLRAGDLEAESLVWVVGMDSWQQATIALGQRASAAGARFEQAGQTEGRAVD